MENLHAGKPDHTIFEILGNIMSLVVCYPSIIAVYNAYKKRSTVGIMMTSMGFMFSVLNAGERTFYVSMNHSDFVPTICASVVLLILVISFVTYIIIKRFLDQKETIIACFVIMAFSIFLIVGLNIIPIVNKGVKPDRVHGGVFIFYQIMCPLWPLICILFNESMENALPIGMQLVQLMSSLFLLICALQKSNNYMKVASIYGIFVCVIYTSIFICRKFCGRRSERGETANQITAAAPSPPSPAKEEEAAPTSVDNTIIEISDVESETSTDLQDQTSATPTESDDDLESATTFSSSPASSASAPPSPSPPWTPHLDSAAQESVIEVV